MKKDKNARIEEYRNRLPHLKERLMGAILLLLVGVIMFTTVSFAWLTLSRSPEVSNITTSVASNGNLEIALASGTRYEPVVPGASKVGDSNLPTSGANLTWGNMINLSDPSYGLGNLVLRPATLNREDLLNSPLYGAEYDESGRRVGYITSFRYAKWQSTDVNDKNAPWEFKLSDELGVRAISSTQMAESSGYAYNLELKRKAAVDANKEAQSAYLSITQNYDIVEGKEKPFLESLAAVMGAYMTANMNATQDNNESLVNATMNKEDVEAFRDLFKAFDKVLEIEREAMLAMANYQLFVLNQGDTSKYNEFTSVDALIAQKDKFSSMGLQITGLSQNLEDSKKLQENYEKLVLICEKGEIKWRDDGLSNIVNSLINVGECTVNGTLVKKIGASAALDLNNKSCATIITNGILYNFETRSGARMNVPKGNTALESKYPKGLPVTAKGKRYGISMDGKIYALITTSATAPSSFQNDLNYANSKNTGGTVALTANDTYGFAIDFWVRTNAVGSYLTLEGNILTETIEEEVLGIDKNGEEVQLYTVTQKFTDESGEEVDVVIDLYPLTEGGVEKWYNAETHEEYAVDSSNPPKKKINVTQNVIGYEGENRVWDNNAFLSTDNTTQGSGSCYIYYADTPEDQARSLKLLSTMNIAFVDDNGNLLAEGYMDTANHFVDNGKVIVPMRLGTNSVSIKNPDGSETLAITALEQNVATRVTAIVYLDGSKVENKDVLAVSDIQGQLNIQFGSSVALNAITDEELASKSMSVSVSAKNLEFDYDACMANNTPMTTNIEVLVDGSTPRSVTAFFIRSISSTQGIPMNGEDEIMSFTNTGGGKWAADYTFTSPGKYILRSVQIDGIEYDLDPQERPVVEVKGFTVRDLKWMSTMSQKQSFMTAASSVSAELELEFVTDDPARMPNSVEGRFLRTDGNSVNVTFKRNVTTNKWSGTANFLSSGEYTLEYLVFNGDYYEIEDSMKKVADVLLGMKTAVYTNSPLKFLYGYGIDNDSENGMTDNEENLYMQIKIMDDTGKELRGLENVKLFYTKEGYQLIELGLNADMKWNASSGYYEGSFKSKVGVFNFMYVTVGDSTITKATTSPSFTIQSPNPPSFNTGNTTPYQYAPNYATNPAVFSISLNDADGLNDGDVIAVITDGKNIYKSSGKKMGSDWNFNVPLNDKNTQDGTWTIQEIHIINYFKDGQMTTEENPYVIDVSRANITTTVLATIQVVLDNTENINKSGAFLEPHTIDQFGITISDAQGNALLEMADTVTLVYSYSSQGSSYTVPAGNTGPYEIKLHKVTDGKANGTYFVQDSNDLLTLKHAGTYTLTSINFTFAGSPIVNGKKEPTQISGNSLPKSSVITITSTVPTVTVSGVRNQDGCSYNSNSATVKYKENSGLCGSKSYDQPYISITLSDIGYATNATLTFNTYPTSGGDVQLYSQEESDNSKTSSFDWTANGSCTRYAGSWSSKSAAGVGTLQADTLEITADGVTYTVRLSTPITIKGQ